MTTPIPPRRVPVGAVGIVVAGLFSQALGASCAVLLIPAAGALGVVMLRLVFAAVILVAIARPKLRGHSRADWLTLIGFGVALAGMNGVFYEALARLPLGATVTIEVLGPLVLSVATSRRISGWIWAVLAFGGVVLLSRGGFTALDPIGILFAFGAAALWAAYILLSQRTGGRFAGVDGLAIALAIGAVLSLPLGIATAGPHLFDPGILAIGLAVAVLSSAVPYGLELVALRRLPAATFAILMSLAPATSTLAGFVILHQAITLLDGLAIAIVVAASIGAVLTARRPTTEFAPLTGPN